MVDIFGQWLDWFVYGVQTLYYAVSDHYTDLLLPSQYEVRDGCRFRIDSFGNRIIDNSQDINMGLCSKICPSCQRSRHNTYFYNESGSIEYIQCSGCRAMGKPLAVNHYASRLYDPPVVHSPVINTVEKKKVPYYDVMIKEKNTSNVKNDLCSGEQVTTWSTVAKKIIKQDNKRMRRIKRQRRRMSIPWQYCGISQSNFEEINKIRFENLWRMGLDDLIPNSLLTDKKWSVFWKEYSQTEYVQSKLLSEKILETK